MGAATAERTLAAYREAAGTPMKVAVNLLWCLPGEVGGSEEYLARQLVGLATWRRTSTPACSCCPGYAAAHRDLAARHELVVAVARRPPPQPPRRSPRQRGCPARTAGADVVHHGGGTVPAALAPADRADRPRPAVPRVPEYFSPVKLRYLRVDRAALGRAGPTSSRCPASTCGGTVVDAFGVDDARVVVVPHGVDPPSRTRRPADERAAARYGLGDRPFVVFPAITHPHKNHRFLLDLLAGPWSDPDLALVLTGRRRAGRRRRRRRPIDALGLGGRVVVRTGRVPAADRDGLIAAAGPWCSRPSTRASARRCSRRWRSARRSSAATAPALPEVAGDAALVRPLTIDAWADAARRGGAARATSSSPPAAAAPRDFTTAASGARLAAAYRLAAGR